MKKIIIISGGVGVLGQSFAKILDKDGYDIILLDVAKPKDKVIGKFFECDITNEENITKLSKHLVSLNTEIYGLINNASCQPEGFTNELENYSTQTFRKVIDVNLTGSFLLTKVVLPYMKKQKFGSIINIGSIQGVVAPTFEIYNGTNITSPLSYSVAKAGIIHFCKWVSAKYGKYNIRCNSVSPGGVSDSQKAGSKFEEKYSSITPLGRMTQSTDIAELIRFLISDKSSYITGQNIIIDGGWTIK